MEYDRGHIGRQEVQQELVDSRSVWDHLTIWSGLSKLFGGSH